jgi:hypothetical protein
MSVSTSDADAPIPHLIKPYHTFLLQVAVVKALLEAGESGKAMNAIDGALAVAGVA